MKKTVSLIVFLILSISLLGGCNKKEEAVTKKDEKKIVVSVPKSPASLPILRMVEANALGEKNKLELKFYSGMEEMMTMANNKNYGFISLPVNAAATMYNKGLDVKLLNVGIWGCVSLVTTDNNCKSVEDFKGQKIYSPQKGSVPELIGQYILKKHGLQAGKDVEFVYATHPEIAQLIKAGKAKYAIDAEPFITVNKNNVENYKVVKKYDDEWKNINGKEYTLPNFGVATNNKFLDENKELVDRFNKEYEKAIKWTKENPEKAGLLAKKYIKANNTIIEKAIVNMDITYKSSKDAKKDLEKYYDVLLNFKAQSVGGKIPDEKFYYNN